MKRLERVLNGFLGCGKTRYLVTYPHIFFGLLSLILPKEPPGATHAKSILQTGSRRKKTGQEKLKKKTKEVKP
ncbi:MAG: hypothetical protein PVH61_08970 [Candidatus Aminicenantes bacterium]|jgi:hypothetical protein